MNSPNWSVFEGNCYFSTTKYSTPLPSPVLTSRDLALMCISKGEKSAVQTCAE